MAHDRGQLIAIANVIPIREVILGPDRLQYSLTIIKRSRRAHLLRPGDDIEDDGPLLIRSRLTANHVNGKLLFTRTQAGEDGEGFVDVLLHPDRLVDQAFGTSVEI